RRPARRHRAHLEPGGRAAARAVLPPRLEPRPAAAAVTTANFRGPLARPPVRSDRWLPLPIARGGVGSPSAGEPFFPLARSREIDADPLVARVPPERHRLERLHAGDRPGMERCGP